ncbi:flagellar filament capping protein FliD [Novosphingobium sp. KACC 22771]|uniref:flagellar filament capping protein FliD n=1 Tax=Novosphingobium sp. KACC 22771 TaxID=3025670 RepID=UPI0023653496|nr:flagellar filament capping protein FliD [Novosphingobium sp. KACC 22771]WDF73249.1 flagellar filament capping protein FliD [Novosphingobium sp. KACC 22771]
MTTTSATSSTSTASTTTTTTSQSAGSVGSQLLTSLGVGTGIDMTAMATNIATAQYATQTDALNSRLSNVALQISQASQLKSDLLTLSSSFSSLIDSGNLLPAPNVTNASVASATLPSGSSGITGTYSLEVTALAQPQVLATTGFSAGAATMKAGTLTFDFGTSNGTTFTPDASRTSKTITIADGATLAQVASAVNSARMGVTAYVATNANGSQLVFKGTEGAANGFTITANDTSTGASTGASSLSTLAYDPGAASATISRQQAAGDAAYKLDGIARTSNSNTIDNAAPGLSLKLTGTNSGNPTTITYSDPSSGITSTMSNLVGALNAIMTELNTDMSAATGNLYNDQGAKAVSRAFSQLAGTTIMKNAADGEPKTLADLGVSTKKDGSFALDTAKLAKALANNPTAVAAMFTKGVNGIYSTVYKMTSSLTTSTDTGSLAGSITRYTTQQTTLTTQKTKLGDQQAALRARLITQYAAANSTVANSNSTLSYLKNQIAAWNKTNN